MTDKCSITTVPRLLAQKICGWVEDLISFIVVYSHSSYGYCIFHIVPLALQAQDKSLSVCMLCRIIFICMINQLYQTAANVHQYPTWTETHSLFEKYIFI